MIEQDHPGLSVRRQAEMLGVNRNRLESRPKVSADDLAVMRLLDEFHLEWPCYGQRKLRVLLREAGREVGRKRLRRLMRLTGIAAIAPKRRTSVPDASHRKYPYLLAGLEIGAPDEVWCADITYIRDGAGLCLSGGHHGLAHPRGARLADLQHAGHTVLPGGVGRSREGGRTRARHLQHRPRLPVHQSRVDRHDRIAGHQGEHGRQGPLARQRVHRAALAQPEVRGHLPQGLPQPGRARGRGCATGSTNTTTGGCTSPTVTNACGNSTGRRPDLTPPPETMKTSAGKLFPGTLRSDELRKRPILAKEPCEQLSSKGGTNQPTTNRPTTRAS